MKKRTKWSRRPTGTAEAARHEARRLRKSGLQIELWKKSWKLRRSEHRSACMTERETRVINTREGK